MTKKQSFDSQFDSIMEKLNVLIGKNKPNECDELIDRVMQSMAVKMLRGESISFARIGQKLVSPSRKMRELAYRPRQRDWLLPLGRLLALQVLVRSAACEKMDEQNKMVKFTIRIAPGQNKDAAKQELWTHLNLGYHSEQDSRISLKTTRYGLEGQLPKFLYERLFKTTLTYSPDTLWTQSYPSCIPDVFKGRIRLIIAEHKSKYNRNP